MTFILPGIWRLSDMDTMLGRLLVLRVSCNIEHVAVPDVTGIMPEATEHA